MPPARLRGAAGAVGADSALSPRRGWTCGRALSAGLLASSTTGAERSGRLGGPATRLRFFSTSTAFVRPPEKLWRTVSVSRFRESGLRVPTRIVLSLLVVSLIRHVLRRSEERRVGKAGRARVS